MSEQAEITPQEVEAAGGSAAVDWLGIVWRRKALLLLGGVLGLAGGLLSYSQSPPVYESSCQVLIIKKRPDAAVGGNNLLEFNDQLATHQAIIKSSVLVERAVKNRALHNLASYAGGGDPTGAIIGSTTTSRATAGVSSQEILHLSFRGPNAQDAATVLNAIVETYKEFLQETYQTISEDTVSQLTQAGQQLRKDLEKKELEYQKFRQNSPLLSPKSKDGPDARHTRLSLLDGRRSSLQLRRAEIEIFLRAIGDGLKQGTPRTTLLAMLVEWNGKLVPDTAKAGTERDVQEQLIALHSEEQKLLGDYGSQHPEVLAVRQRVELLRHYASLPRSAYNRIPEVMQAGERPGAVDALEIHLQVLREELKQIRFAEEALGALYQQEIEQVRKADNYEYQEESIRNDITRSQQLYDGIIKRLQEVDFSKTAGGYDARVISWAKPGRQVAPKLLTAILPVLMLGLVVGAGLAYLAERSDQSFRTPEEIRQRLGLAIVGHIPAMQPCPVAADQLSEQGQPLDPLLCSFHQPKSTHAEAYRGVRTALYFSMTGPGHQLLAVTSPNPGDGKSTVIANLAVSMAQSGKKVILVDADLRRARQHEIFGIQADVGLADVLAGTAEYGATVRPTATPNLALLPCGRHPDNPAELLTSGRFKELLVALRAEYDFVLVDCPPLLAVSDPSVVASRVDGMLLVVRISRDGRGDAVRAKEILKSVGANVVGVIVNGVGKGGGSGYAYYSGYNYYSYGQYRSNPYYERDADANGQSANGQSADGAPRLPPAAPTMIRRRPGSRTRGNWLQRWFGGRGHS